jgi:hypothetical protein
MFPEGAKLYRKRIGRVGHLHVRQTDERVGIAARRLVPDVWNDVNRLNVNSV